MVILPHAWRRIVLYLSSTSNHNLRRLVVHRHVLSYISLLHQTTTNSFLRVVTLFCLISLFYIKPQPCPSSTPSGIFVLYLSSTSNHNIQITRKAAYDLSYISLLHQTTTSSTVVSSGTTLSYISLLHQTTTYPLSILHNNILSYISLLHQTTTLAGVAALDDVCLISLFYIKPQPSRRTVSCTMLCLISLFYIKPQLRYDGVRTCQFCLISLFYIKPQLLVNVW